MPALVRRPHKHVLAAWLQCHGWAAQCIDFTRAKALLYALRRCNQHHAVMLSRHHQLLPMPSVHECSDFLEDMHWVEIVAWTAYTKSPSAWRTITVSLCRSHGTCNTVIVHEVAAALAGMTIAGSRSAAYLEAQRRIAVTIRNMYEVGQRVPPSASAMSLSAAQAWDSSHREVLSCFHGHAHIAHTSMLLRSLCHRCHLG